MFTPLVLRRNFSLLNRVPHSHIVRSAVRNGHESVVIQRVRISRPFFSKTRLVGTVTIAVATYGLARYLGLEVEIEEIDESSHAGRSADSGQDGWEVAGPTADDDDEDEDDTLLFLPTGLSRPRGRVFYKGSDPEWQTFKQIAADRPRADKIRGELVRTIRRNAARKPELVQRLGNIDTTKGMSWIEFQFPMGPPVEFERPGIELTDSLEWRKATRPVDENNHRRLDRVLFPKGAADAFYKDTARRAGKAWKNLKLYMGWDQESKTETVQEIFQRIGANHQSTGQATSIAPNRFSTPANDTQQPGVSASAAPIDGPASIGFVLPDPKSMTLDLAQFRTDMAKATTVQFQPPRGTFIVKGLIEIYGERARLTVNVNAVYDPKQGKYVWMASSLWNFVEHQQLPRGGP